MAKFKVGDRVQVVDDRGGRKLGETGEIVGIDITLSTAFYYIKWDAGVPEQGLYENRLEALLVAGATGEPAFKVGDRVRVLSDDLPWAHGGEIGIVQKVDKRDRDCFVKFETERMGGHTWYVRWDNLELAPALTIETGKFYRTRDGRRVGPMDEWVIGRFRERIGDERYWSASGVGQFHAAGEDLIAEWVDEPASNDNAPATAPAIVALIEGGQPKPSEQPKVHKSDQAATDEAERLAVKYPGQKFGVFVLADSRIADVVIRRAA